MTDNIILVSTPEDLIRSWCVYMLYDAKTAIVQYIGYCPLTEVFYTPDARAKSLFNTIFPGDKLLMLRVLETCDDRKIARHARTLIMNNTGRPILNREVDSTRSTSVKCIETGEIFVDAATCAKEHNLSQPALSNHLNRKAGYNSVKNKTYERITK